MILPALPWVATALAGAAVAAACWERGRPRVWTPRLLWAATAIAVLVVAVLVALFVTSQVQYAYVFLYSHAELPLRYKIAGAWAGREGSLALWALYTIAIAAVASRRWRHGPGHGTALVVLSALATAFLAAVAWSDLFGPTSDFFLQQRPLGNGLNPTLQNDFFLIHPPLMFLAYALMNIPAAAAIGHAWDGSHQWSEVSGTGSRIGWLFYTAAMGLGGIWAYYTLGFGGYWAWDPVEVANLLPWLALTLYLHARLHHERHGRFANIGPFLAMLPFLLTLFSTISTRSGLWVSVHAFTDPTQTFNPDAPGRFLDILGVEAALAFYVGLFLATLAAFLALWARRLAIDHQVLARSSRITAGVLGAFAVYAAIAPVSAYSLVAQAGHVVGRGDVGLGMLVVAVVAVVVPAAPIFLAKDDRRTRLDLQGLAYASVLILGGGLLILFLWHMAAANGWSTAFYEARLPYLATPAMTALIVFMTLPLGKRPALLAGGVLLVIAGLAAWLLDPGRGFIVLATGVLVAGLDRLRRAALARAPSRAQWGRALLALGALLDLLFWLNPPTDLVGPLRGVWPIQLVLGAAALWLWHRSLQHMAGRPGAGRTAWGVALLGGFYVAPVLALVGWWLQRRVPSGRYQEARMKQAALYAMHLGVAVALVGYGTSTYLATEGEAVLDARVAGLEMEHADTQVIVEDGMAQRFEMVVATPHGTVTAPLYWEPQTGSYYPLPGTLRTWWGDVYVSVDRICVDPDGSCDGPIDTVTAFEPTFQRAPAPVHDVAVTAHVLPGLGLVWGALALFVHAMAVLLTQSGIDLSAKSSRDPA